MDPDVLVVVLSTELFRNFGEKSLSLLRFIINFAHSSELFRIFHNGSSTALATELFRI